MHWIPNRIAVSLRFDVNLTSFSSRLCHSRSNESLVHKGFVVPKAIKTGTTIVGIIYKDGVILGADTRATEGPIVADKNC